MKTDSVEQFGAQITRQEAIKKAGKYAAFTAAATILLLSPKQAVATSNPDDPGGGWGTGPVAPPGGKNGSQKSSLFEKPEHKQEKQGIGGSPWK
jgi:hypothetical protein